VRIDQKLTTKCWVGFIDWLDGLVGGRNAMCKNSVTHYSTDQEAEENAAPTHRRPDVLSSESRYLTERRNNCRQRAPGTDEHCLERVSRSKWTPVPSRRSELSFGKIKPNDSPDGHKDDGYRAKYDSKTSSVEFARLRLAREKAAPEEEQNQQPVDNLPMSAASECILLNELAKCHTI
jgi:PAB1-binding protein PBP1